MYKKDAGKYEWIFNQVFEVLVKKSLKTSEKLAKESYSF
jgi:hypothetical protein